MSLILSFIFIISMFSDFKISVFQKLINIIDVISLERDS